MEDFAYSIVKSLLMIKFAGGVLTGFVLSAICAYGYVSFGGFPVGADVKPPALERSLARSSLQRAVSAALLPIPAAYVHPSDSVIASGAKLYLANCSVCHGNGAANGERFTAGLYIKAPQFAKDGVDDDPTGETFWKIDHGIRFTAMPAFQTVLNVDQMWAIAAFLKQPAEELPPAAKALWNRRV